MFRANGCRLVLLWKQRPFSLQSCVLKAFELKYSNGPCVPCGYYRSHLFSAEGPQHQGSDKCSLPVLWATSKCREWAREKLQHFWYLCRMKGLAIPRGGACCLVPGDSSGLPPEVNTIQYSTEGKKPWRLQVCSFYSVCYLRSISNYGNVFSIMCRMIWGLWWCGEKHLKSFKKIFFNCREKLLQLFSFSWCSGSLLFCVFFVGIESTSESSQFVGYANY